MNNIFTLNSISVVLVKDVSEIISSSSILSEFDKQIFTKEENRSNYMSSKNFHFFDTLSDGEKIKSFFENEANEFLKNLHVKTNGRLKVTNSWCNITNKDEIHHPHTHPFSVVSGVVFLDDNPENLNLAFFDNKNGIIPYYDMIQLPVVTPLKQFYNQDRDSGFLKNHLVMFISSIDHFVNTVSSDMCRRSIAFNTFWTGFVGKEGVELGSHVF